MRWEEFIPMIGMPIMANRLAKEDRPFHEKAFEMGVGSAINVGLTIYSGSKNYMAATRIMRGAKVGFAMARFSPYIVPAAIVIAGINLITSPTATYGTRVHYGDVRSLHAVPGFTFGFV